MAEEKKTEGIVSREPLLNTIIDKAFVGKDLKVSDAVQQALTEFINNWPFQNQRKILKAVYLGKHIKDISLTFGDVLSTEVPITVDGSVNLKNFPVEAVVEIEKPGGEITEEKKDKKK